MPGPPSPAHPADTAPAPVPAESWQRAVAAAPLVRGPAPGSLPRRADLVIIAAHPDDEVIGAGRLAAGHEGRVRAITLTAGEGCHGGHADPAELSRTRLAEWRDGLAVLGAEPLESPRWPDGALSAHQEPAVTAVATLAEGAQAVLAPWRHDPHPDHEAAGRIAEEVSRRLRVPLWSYLVWTPYWLHPEDLGRHGAELVSHPTSAQAASSWREALACHRSQLTARPPAARPVVPAELVSRHDLPDRQLLIRRRNAQRS